MSKEEKIQEEDVQNNEQESKKIEDHIKVANELLKNGYAYKCYCSSEEIEEQKILDTKVCLASILNVQGKYMEVYGAFSVFFFKEAYPFKRPC